MKVKSFYGNSIKDALDKARRELGPDAAILASRQLRPEEGGGCEVVCTMDGVARGQGNARIETSRTREARMGNRPGTRPGTQPSAEPAAGIDLSNRTQGQQSAGTTAKPAHDGRTKRGITRIRKQIEALVHPAVDEFGSERVRTQLLAAGFEADLANEVIAGVRQRQRSGVECDTAVVDEIAARLALAPQLGSSHAERRIVAFAGAPGTGKTTSLVKLAVRYGLRGRKPMHIISMDSWRIGGADALRTYAAGMGVTFEAIETAERLRQSLEEHTGKGLILIDTPGLAPANVKAAAPLASLLSSHPEVEVQMVIPAWVSPAVMKSIADRCRPFLPSKLLVTGADCADSCLAAAGLALSLEKPVSFISTGQIIPEDIEEATAARLLGTGTVAETKKTATSAA
jgi:flagellar biosynthesis protein FlhF